MRWGGLAWIGLGAVGCKGGFTDSFEANARIDVLFAVDKSGSMDDDARRLGRAFGDFIDRIGAATPDWQIGVVTRDSGCFNNGILTAATPDYEEVFLDAVARQSVVEPGLTEALLAMIDSALVQTGPEGCNAGFRRPDSRLHIVAVSDEPEQSGRRPEHWLDRWWSRMDHPEDLVVNAIVDEHGSCGGEASGYVEAVDATGGLVLDLCTREWSSFAAELGAASAEDLRTFRLSHEPEEDTIRVRIDGRREREGWRYDPDDNAIFVESELDRGVRVDVTYRCEDRSC